MFGEDPIERILGWERSFAHPSYQLQAFVQTPSMEPDPTLSFEKGEVIYENKRVAEWINFWRVLFGVTLPFWPMFYTFEIYAGDSTPSLPWLGDMTVLIDVPQ